MRSLTLFIILISFTAFWFANSVIPWAEYKSLNLRRNIAQKKPAMVIAEGQFSPIGEELNIKVEKKTGDRDQFLEEVIIHKKKPKIAGNYTVMVAERGELIGSEDSNVLSLKLDNVYYYDEVQPRDIQKKKKKPFVKSYLDVYTINIDLSEINNIDLEAEGELSNHGMYPISELIPAIDTLSDNFSTDIKTFANTMYLRSGVPSIGENYAPKEPKDTVYNPLDAFQPVDQKKIIQIAQSHVSGTLQTLEAKKDEFFLKRKNIIKHEIALHEKYVFAIACVILFFIGAPLGAIIRKGGFGLPMVIAILLFLTYHFIGIFAKNSAEDGSLNAVMATWLSSLILLPLGIWITYRATTDQNVFDFDSFFGRFRRRPKLAPVANQVALSQQQKDELAALDNDGLIRVVKYHRKFGYSSTYRNQALLYLEQRGISELELRMQGNFEDHIYNEAMLAYGEYKKLSKQTLYMYLLSVALSILFLFFAIYDAQVGAFLEAALPVVYYATLAFFYIKLIQTFLWHNKIYKAMKQKTPVDIIVGYLLFGLPLFYFFKRTFDKRIEADIKQL
jgi:lipopolysaccharide export system permease protein